MTDYHTYEVRRVDDGAVLVRVHVPKRSHFRWNAPIADRPEGVLQTFLDRYDGEGFEAAGLPWAFWLR